MSALGNIQHKEEELIVCKNGLIDLRSGKLLPPGLVHTMVTQNHMLNINYKCKEDLKPEMEEKFLDYLKKIFPADNIRRDVFEFLWVALTDYEAKVMQCHWGPGSGGKTTFFNAVNYLFGSYCGFGDSEMLMNDEMFDVGNERLIIFDDLCGVVSADKIRNKAKVILVANNNLEIRDDRSVWKRLQFIPWMTYFFDRQTSFHWHPKKSLAARYKYPIDPYYETETWYDAMGPYFLNLVLDYGKNVVCRMNIGLPPYPISSSDQPNIDYAAKIKEAEEFLMDMVDNGEEQKDYDGQDTNNVEDNIFEDDGKSDENEQDNVGIINKVIDEEKPTLIEADNKFTD